MNLTEYLFDVTHWQAGGTIAVGLVQHLFYTGAAVGIAALLAIPLGIGIGHTGRGSFLVVGFSNAMRSVPTLGLLVLAVLVLGTGRVNVIGVLAVLALPPILTATAAGIQGADREAVHAARALGMSEAQVISKVEWPLGLPLVISGLRSATLQVVATATVAAYAAGGGLGRLLISGQASQDYPQMFAGAVLVAILAIVLDVLLGGLGWLLARRSRPGRKIPSIMAAAPV
jgi:osmoprotectant transport system permease protein